MNATEIPTIRIMSFIVCPRLTNDMIYYSQYWLTNTFSLQIFGKIVSPAVKSIDNSSILLIALGKLNSKIGIAPATTVRYGACQVG